MRGFYALGLPRSPALEEPVLLAEDAAKTSGTDDLSVRRTLIEADHKEHTRNISSVTWWLAGSALMALVAMRASIKRSARATRGASEAASAARGQEVATLASNAIQPGDVGFGGARAASVDRSVAVACKCAARLNAAVTLDRKSVV